jgi:hypothetical protein
MMVMMMMAESDSTLLSFLLTVASVSHWNAVVSVKGTGTAVSVCDAYQLEAGYT